MFSESLQNEQMGVSKKVQFYSGRIEYIHIHHFEKLKFIANLSKCNNIAVSTCYKLFSHSNELKTLSWFYDIPQDYSINSV